MNYNLTFYAVLFLLLSPFLFSCQDANSNLVYGNYGLIESAELKFPLDYETSYRTFFVKTIKNTDGSELLAFLSMHKPSIQFFDIKTQTLFREIELSKDGPNGVGSPSGLMIKSLDSIFVISSTHYKVSLIDGEGSVQKTYRVLEGTTYNENTGMLRPYTIAPPVLIKDVMYFNVAPDRDVYKPSYFEGHTNLMLNVSEESYQYFNNYPLEFRDGVWGVAAVNFSSTYSPKIEKFVYSFAISDSIDTFDPKTGEKERFFAGSSLKDNKSTPMVKRENSADLPFALQATYYNGIVYDEYRDVYYRFVRHPISYKDDNGEINEFHEKPVSVIILDNQFQVLGEVKLNENTYLDYIYFVSKEGICLSTGNPENPDMDENYAEFQCFKPQP